ncbi:MAG: hypothetical protein GF334_09990 [Candidatus Altiarchaeales archaeon]|nr:hypothetical protein [Candidatus Altiarchaeales archaeon]
MIIAALSSLLTVLFTSTLNPFWTEKIRSWVAQIIRKKHDTPTLYSYLRKIGRQKFALPQFLRLISAWLLVFLFSTHQINLQLPPALLLLTTLTTLTWLTYFVDEKRNLNLIEAKKKAPIHLIHLLPLLLALIFYADGGTQQLIHTQNPFFTDKTPVNTFNAASALRFMNNLNPAMQTTLGLVLSLTYLAGFILLRKNLAQSTTNQTGFLLFSASTSLYATFFFGVPVNLLLPGLTLLHILLSLIPQTIYTLLISLLPAEIRKTLFLS